MAVAPWSVDQFCSINNIPIMSNRLLGIQLFCKSRTGCQDSGAQLHMGHRLLALFTVMGSSRSFLFCLFGDALRHLLPTYGCRRTYSAPL